MAESDNNKNSDKEVKIEAQMPEVQQELSKVATSPRQNILILVAIIGVFGYVAFNFFISNNNTQQIQQPSVTMPSQVTKPAEVSKADVPSIPKLPEPPKLEEPLLPPPPPPQAVNQPNDKSAEVATPAVPSLPNIPASDNSNLPALDEKLQVDTPPPVQLAESEESKKRREAKRKATIVLIAGTPEKKTPEQIQQEADFKDLGQMEMVLARGKIIDAVLETTLNTDFGGEIRAVISRDVYSESGKVILIPKGSRVFGSYTTSKGEAYGRIAIEWVRVSLASGYILNLQGTGVDKLGRKGESGRVDNKFRERFSNAVLMSAFNIAFAKGIDTIVKPPISSQAATQNTQAATNLNNIAQAINADTTKDAATKVQLICTNVQAAITDKTSTAYTNFTATCTSLTTAVNGDANQNLQSALGAVNAAAAALLTNTTSQVTPSKAQDAAKQAFTDVTDTVKDMISEQKFTPTITIDQGTPVKIYVNRDYKFPKAALNKSRRLVP